MKKYKESYVVYEKDRGEVPKKRHSIGGTWGQRKNFVSENK